MEEVIIQTLVDKVNAHDEKFYEQNKTSQELAGKVSNLKSEAEQLQKIVKAVSELEVNLAQVKWPVAEIDKLVDALHYNNYLLENPKSQKILHKHTGSKMLWSLIGVSVVAAFLIFGWITTYRSLRQYQMYDTCWRFLKLESGTNKMPSLSDIEWRYRNDPDAMIGHVEQQELLIKQEAELQLKLRKVQEDKSANQITPD